MLLSASLLSLSSCRKKDSPKAHDPGNIFAGTQWEYSDTRTSEENNDPKTYTEVIHFVDDTYVTYSSTSRVTKRRITQGTDRDPCSQGNIHLSRECSQGNLRRGRGRQTREASHYDDHRCHQAKAHGLDDRRGRDINRRIYSQEVKAKLSLSSDSPHPLPSQECGANSIQLILARGTTHL